VDINFVNAEVLKVGPDEVLIIHFKEDFIGPDGVDDGIIEALLDHLKMIGLEYRSLVLVGDAEFSSVKRDD